LPFSVSDDCRAIIDAGSSLTEDRGDAVEEPTMDDHVDDRTDSNGRQPVGRLRPAMGGRSLALPPLAPIVAMLGLAWGVMIGFGLAPRAAPTAAAGASPASAAIESTTSPTPSDTAAAPSASVPAASVPAASLPTAAPSETPPPDGLSLAEALADLDALGMASSGEVVMARVAQISDQPLLPIAPETPPTLWVWEFVVQGVPDCLNPNGPCLSTTELIVLDYRSGAFVRGVTPAPEL
jgi:hypothetical protein